MSMDIKSLSKIAKEFGYTLTTKNKGRHSTKYINEETGHKIPVPGLKSGGIASPTANNILKQMGYKKPEKNAKINIDAELKEELKKKVKEIQKIRKWKKEMKNAVVRGLGSKPRTESFP